MDTVCTGQWNTRQLGQFFGQSTVLLYPDGEELMFACYSVDFNSCESLVCVFLKYKNFLD